MFDFVYGETTNINFWHPGKKPVKRLRRVAETLRLLFTSLNNMSRYGKREMALSNARKTNTEGTPTCL